MEKQPFFRAATAGLGKYHTGGYGRIGVCRVKPIFHCNAKPFALGTFASPNTKDSTFASPYAKIPTCWYISH